MQGYTVILSHSWWSNLAIFHNLAARSSPPWPSPHFGRCHAFAKPEGLHTNWSDSIHGNLRVRHPPPQEIAGLIQDSLRGLWWVHGPLISLISGGVETLDSHYSLHQGEYLDKRSRSSGSPVVLSKFFTKTCKFCFRSISTLVRRRLKCSHFTSCISLSHNLLRSQLQPHANW